MKPFNKQPETPEQLLDRQIARGLVVTDRDAALAYLKHVGGYRLKGFWFQLTDPTTKQFRNRTSFQDIADRYEFDRKLRALTFDEVGRLEVAIRSCISNLLSQNHGAHWFMDSRIFRPDPQFGFGSLLKTIEDGVKRSKAPFVSHYTRNYDVPCLPPSWGVAECLMFGFWSQMYRILRHSQDKKQISMAFGVSEPEVFASWLHCLVYLRNLSCHHGRILNSNLVISPQRYKKCNVQFPHQNKFHAPATVINFLIRNTGMPTTWKSDLLALFARYPHIQPIELGFGPQWDQKPGW